MKIHLYCKLTGNHVFWKKLTLWFFYIFFLLCFFLSSCISDKSITFQSIDDVSFDWKNKKGLLPALVLKVSFYNSTIYSIKLKKIQLDIFLDETKVVTLNEPFQILIKAKSNFVLPLRSELALEKFGFATRVLLSLIRDKNYTIRFVGYATVVFFGISIDIPIDYIRK